LTAKRGEIRIRARRRSGQWCAAILLRYADGDGPTAIQKALGLSRPTIYKCIDKALAAGVEAGLEDRYHRPKEPVITQESKAWS